jgi:GGDEF domain-containing protein
MLQQPAFQELLDGGEPFSGLVISIGVNESDSSMWHRQGLMQSVATYIAALLREKEFSCRTGYDEFIMVCYGEQGPQSQRRLNHISERLWDYQLRGIGTCSILFSWGGVEVQDQPLAEAVASAVDRMRQTKRAGSPSGLAGAHRKAV